LLNIKINEFINFNNSLENRKNFVAHSNGGH